MGECGILPSFRTSSALEAGRCPKVIFSYMVLNRCILT